MTSMLHFVTGATGLLGSHIAEQLVQRGDRVRALVRTGSNISFLQSIGVELAEGDLEDRAALVRATKGADIVHHSAAKVGDWGPWRAFKKGVLDATQNILHACSTNHVKRVVYVSSTSAYGHPPPDAGTIAEDYPLGDRFWIWDYYTRSKVEAEKMVWAYIKQHEGSERSATIIRPSWLYGPRDRTSIFRLAKSHRMGRVRILGKGDNRINSVYAGNVAEACLLAADHPNAAGQAYNITNDGFITQQQYMNLYADALDCKRPFRHMPYELAFGSAFVLEAVFRALHMPAPPFVTRYGAWLLGRNTYYSTEKAEGELGWRPRIGYEEGIRKTVAWYLENNS